VKIVGRGRPRIRFDAAEVALLGQLFDELEGLLDPAEVGLQSDEAVQDRLFPAAHDNASVADEFRGLTEDTLRSERRERIGACRADIADAAEVGLDDPDVVRRWLQVLNDLRLVHGTRLGVSEDDDLDIDPDDPEQIPRLVYHWLSGVQDLVVRSVMN
jgi:uncharacterized protein DUF2017